MSTEKFLPFAFGLVLCGVILFLYCGALDADFVNFDDNFYGSENPIVASGITNYRSVVYAWTTLDYGNWTPLTWMSLELDATLFGPAPGPFHRTNILLHALNSLLLFIAIRRMTGATGRSAIVALFFAVHPLHVESVAWISERRDVLSTSFLLIALIAYERYAASPHWGRWMLVALAMTLGLMAKSMLVTLPILLLLLDWWPLNRVAEAAGKTKLSGPGRESAAHAELAPEILRGSSSPLLPYSDNDLNFRPRYPQRTVIALVLEKLPLFGLSLIDGVITIIAQRNEKFVVPLDLVPLHFRFGNALQSYGWYLWKTIVPTNLCILYAHPGRDLAWGSVTLATLVLIAATIFACRDPIGRRYRQFGWAWFVSALLPVIGLLQVGTQAHADRYIYIPHIGLFILIVWEAHAWQKDRNLDVRWGIAAAVGISIFWSARTIEQVAVWHNSESLWLQALRVDPRCDRAHLNFGIALYEQGRFDEAEQHLRQSMVHGADVRAVHNLGLIHEHREDWESAIDCFRWALRIEPDSSSSNEHLALLLRRNPPSEVPGTRPRSPSPARAQLQQGLSAARNGDMTAALIHFQSAIEIDPDNADAYNNAALALAELKRPLDAEKTQRQAVLLAPDNPDFHVNLAVVLEKNNNLTEALSHYQAALRLRPKDAEVERRLRIVEEQINRP